MKYMLNVVFNHLNPFKRLFGTRNMTSLPNRLVWIDLELTGLDVSVCHILEVACIITEGNLDLVSEGPNLIIHQPESVLSSMNEWCVLNHAQTGLTEACRQSTISLEQAESQLLEFISKYTIPGQCYLAGNTVYMDKMFIAKYMPRIDQHLHYRIVDVSTLKILCSSWFPNEIVPRKKLVHRSLADIKESIEELKFYKNNIFKTN